MSLQNLTQNAKQFFTTISFGVNSEAIEVLKADNIYKELKRSSGLASVIIKSAKKIKYNTKKEVNIEHLLKEAYFQAASLEHSYVGTEHILLSLLKLVDSPDYEVIKAQLLGMNLFPRALNLLTDKKESVILESFSENLTKSLARSYTEPLLSRPELNKIISVLFKKENANVLLVGEPGVGKRSLLQLLAHSINTLDIPTLLAGYQVIEFDLMGYLTSIANKGSIEQSFSLLEEELKSQKRLILVLKNFQNMFISTTAGVGIPILLPLFKDLLQNADVSFIVTMNASVYDRLEMDNAQILDTFTVVEVSEPSEVEILKMMHVKATTLEEFHNVKISPQLIKYVYETAKNNETGISFPQRGIDLLDSACAHLLVRKSRVPREYKTFVDESISTMEKLYALTSAGNYDEAIKLQGKLDKIDTKLNLLEDKMIFSSALKLTKEDVDTAFLDLEVNLLSPEVDTKYLSRLDETIKKELVGQDAAIEAVVKGLIRARLGLRDKNRPIGNFLFLGPTGVGKTELAKILSKHAFGKDGKNHLIRLDMSDFSEKHTVARLIGSPPGYVGYNDGGELTSKISLNPESIVLFDEIEKAHPDVLNILLQITEEGELSDSKGTTFDFSKAIIILTSNLGTEILHNKEIGFKESIKTGDDSVVEKHLKENLKRILKPELLNRFDDIIVFRRLTKSDQLKVLELLLNEVDKRLVAQDVFLNVSKKAKEVLLNSGYSQEYGARSLRRVIEKELLDKVAELLLDSYQKPLYLKTKVSKDKLEVHIK